MRGRLTIAPVPDLQSVGLGLIGLLGLASAGLSSLFVREHAALCGAGAHCGWCFAAAGFVVVGAAALIAAATADRSTR